MTETLTDLNVDDLIATMKADNLARYGDECSSMAWAYVCGMLMSSIKFGESAENVQRYIDDLTRAKREALQDYLKERQA